MSQHEGRSTLAISRPKAKPVLVKEEKKEGEKRVKRKLKMVREIIDLEEAERIAEKFLDKFLFMRKENFVTKMKIYWPFWLVEAVGDSKIYFLFDAVTGEIPGSKGLQRVSDLSPIAVKILSHSGTVEEIAEKVGIDRRGAKLQLNRLVKLGLVRVRGRKKPVYYPKVRIPEKIEEFEGEVVEAPCEGRILKHVFEPSAKLMKALGLKVISKELIYVPFAYFRTDRKKEIIVNLSNGKAEVRRLRLRI